MELSDVWKSVTHVRNEEEEIIAVQVPIDVWRFLIDRVQQMEDREAARLRHGEVQQHHPRQVSSVYVAQSRPPSDPCRSQQVRGGFGRGRALAAWLYAGRFHSPPGVLARCDAP